MSSTACLLSSLQVAGLALNKLFDNFTIAELVSSMEAMITGSHVKPEVWGEESSAHSLSVTVSAGGLVEC